MINFKEIISKEQYFEYCNLLEELLLSDPDEENEQIQKKIQELAFFIHLYDEENAPKFVKIKAIDLLQYLMESHGLKPEELAQKADLHEDSITQILSGEITISISIAEKLASYFKLRKEAFVEE